MGANAAGIPQGCRPVVFSGDGDDARGRQAFVGSSTATVST